jgi:hypothetical protein
MSDLCIYCLREGVGSKEHILQSGLGVTWWSEQIVCDTCNHSFSGGDHIDTALVEAFQSLRSRLWIFDGRRKPPARLREHTKDMHGRPLDLLPGGRVSLSETKVEQCDSRATLISGAAVRSMARFRDVVRQYAAEPHSVSVLSSVEDAGPVLTPHVLPDEVGERGIAKSCFNFLGAVEPELARSKLFNPLRSYIQDAGDTRPVGTFLDMISPLPIPVPIPAHAIFLSSTTTPSALVAQVALFGSFRYTVVLCEDYCGPSISKGVIMDPWRRTTEPLSGLNLPIESREITRRGLQVQGPHLRQAFEQIDVIARYVQAWTDTVVKVLRGCQSAGVKKGDLIPASASSHIADEVEKARLGLPSTLVLESLDEAVRREQELERLLESLARKAPWRNMISHTSPRCG